MCIRDSINSNLTTSEYSQKSVKTLGCNDQWMDTEHETELTDKHFHYPNENYIINNWY